MLQERIQADVYVQYSGISAGICQGNRVLGFGFFCSGFKLTLTYQNLLFYRVPIKSLLGSILRTYKKVGFRLR